MNNNNWIGKMVLLSVFSTMLIKHKGNQKPNHLPKQGFQRKKFKIISTTKGCSRDSGGQMICMTNRKNHYSGFNSPLKSQNRVKNRKNWRNRLPKLNKEFYGGLLQIVWPLGSWAALIKILDRMDLSFKSLVIFEGLASKGLYMPTRVR